MIINDLENSSFVVNSGVSFKEAMSIITSNRRGCVLAVDENNHLIGVLSDGDIRRALVKGVSILSSIENAINHNPIILKKEHGNIEEAEKIFTEKIFINLIPVVDSDNVLVYLIVRD